MKQFLRLICFASILLVTSGDIHDDKYDDWRPNTIRHAQVLYRCGTHALDYKTVFPNLPNVFKESIGELTEPGKVQMFNLGNKIRQRYGFLYNDTYNPYWVRLISGSINRTITSANLVAAGMFPIQAEFESWDDNLPWQPVPVHSDDRFSTTGAIMLALKDRCPSLRFVRFTPEYHSIERDWRLVIEYFTKNADTPNQDVHSAFLVASALSIYASTNMTLPAWINETTKAQAVAFYWEITYFLATVPQVVRLSAGWFIGYIIQEFREAIQYKQLRKFQSYSTHDDNLSTMISAIAGEIPSFWPQFSSFLAIELHVYNGTEYVEVWRDSIKETGKEYMVRVKIANCKEPCSLRDFEEISKKAWMQSDWLAECLGGWSPTAPGKGLFGSTVELCVIVLLCATFFIGSLISLLFWRDMSKKLPKDYGYRDNLGQSHEHKDYKMF